MQVDPSRQFWNSYSYVGNNPVMGTDSTGMWVDGYSKWYKPSTWGAEIGQANVTDFFMNGDPFDANAVAYFSSQEFVPHDVDASVIVFRPRQEDTPFPKMKFSCDPRYNAEAYAYHEGGVMGPFLASTTTSDEVGYANIVPGQYFAVNHSHKGAYPALRLMTLTDTYLWPGNRNQLPVVEGINPNPSMNGATYADTINIHSAIRFGSQKNSPGFTNSGRPISTGCLLISTKQYNFFINYIGGQPGAGRLHHGVYISPSFKYE